ncbi:MAG: hypothetical protein PW734_01860 [Verrucomicrobium sp.]|nr:hypothetical protein [Verrucomicrobium sp.]
MAKMKALLEKVPVAGDVATLWNIGKGSLQTVNHLARGEVRLGIQRAAVVGARVALEAADLEVVGEMIRPAAATALQAADAHLDRRTKAHRLEKAQMKEASRVLVADGRSASPEGRALA